MPLSIGFIITTFLQNVNYTRLLALAGDQRRRGRKVEIITGINASPRLVAEARGQGIPVTQIPLLRKYVYPYQDLLALRALIAICRQRRFDLVHTVLAKAGILGRLAGRLAGVPRLVHTVCGASFAASQPPLPYLVYRNLERLIGRMTDRFLFVGQEIRNVYLAAGICTPQQCAVIYGGRDLSAFFHQARLSWEERLVQRQAWGIGGDAVVLGNVSRLVPWKGHGYALEVLKKLRSCGLKVKLILVGDARTPAEKRYKQELLSWVRRAGLEDTVIFTGWQTDPSSFYALFDLYLLTSMPFEGIPGSAIEAAVMGVPVVGFECPGVREIPAVQCQLVPRGDVAALTAAVEEEIAGITACRQVWGQPRPELETIRNRFSLAGMVARTNTLYETLLARPAGENQPVFFPSLSLAAENPHPYRLGK